MVSLALTTFGLLMLAASWALMRAMRRAPDGYEDELGFHEGIPPRPVAVAKEAARKRVRRVPDQNRANQHVSSV